MIEHQYLIIGGGMTAAAAVQSISQIDLPHKIGIISDETSPPYDRPPLSKGLWKDEPLEKIWRKSIVDSVEIYSSRRVKSIDVRNKRVIDDKDVVYAYNKLLLATGGRVRRFPWNEDGIIYYRTLDDYQKLRILTEKGNEFVIIGGGFIGSEIAAALTMNHKSVTMIFPDDAIGARVYPQDLSRFLNTFYRSKGINVHAKESVVGVEKKDSCYIVKTSSGMEVKADGVVAGIGILPNQELAESAGLDVGNGILVDEFLRTNNPDIYAAGDVANFYSSALGKRVRVEHEDNANTMGEIAGKNMAGDNAAYHHLPFFYSDLFELGYEAVGELDARLETVEDWKSEYREGVVYYLNEGRVRGVLLWNTWGQVETARTLIAEKGPFHARNLKQRIPV